MSSTVHEFTLKEGRHTEPNGKCPDGQVISLLAFLEKENRDLKKFVMYLALETLLLKSLLHGDEG